MASLWKHPNSPFWVACFTVHSASSQLRWKRSLKTRDLKLARKIADALEDVGRGAMLDKDANAFCEKIADARVRHVAVKTFADVFRAVHGRELGGASFRAFVQDWLNRIEPELAPQSFDKYKKVAEDFVALIGPAANRDVMSFGSRDEILVLRFRENTAARVAASTVNTSMKIVRQMFKSAAQRFKIESPAMHVSGVRDREEGSTVRRAFNLPELERVFRIADGEWKGICLAGLYTGQRLSDIATWRWENVDLVRREIAFASRKTARRMLIPIAAPLADFLLSLPATDDPAAYVFSKAAGHVARAKSEQSATLSNQFHELLARAGLVRRRSHARKQDGAGRAARRQASELSFHSFRHTATSLLKNAGVPQSVVMDIIGHDSAAISQAYTHVGDAEKREAVRSLPSLAKIRASGSQPLSAKQERKQKRKQQ